jgi:hypothetical protein
MIRTYPDGTVYESDFTDIELRHPDNQVAMELVEALRKVSRKLEAVEAEFKAYEIERATEWSFAAASRKEERAEFDRETTALKATAAALQAKLDAAKAVLA